MAQTHFSESSHQPVLGHGLPSLVCLLEDVQPPKIYCAHFQGEQREVSAAQMFVYILDMTVQDLLLLYVHPALVQF